MSCCPYSHGTYKFHTKAVPPEIIWYLSHSLVHCELQSYFAQSSIIYMQRLQIGNKKKYPLDSLSVRQSAFLINHLNSQLHMCRGDDLNKKRIPQLLETNRAFAFLPNEALQYYYFQNKNAPDETVCLLLQYQPFLTWFVSSCKHLRFLLTFLNYIL